MDEEAASQRTLHDAARFGVRFAVGQRPLQVCGDIGKRATAKCTVVASALKARSGRHDRHFLCDAVDQAADDRSHMGAVPVAPTAVAWEDAIDGLARVALGALEGRVPINHATSEVHVRALDARVHNVHPHTFAS